MNFFAQLVTWLQMLFSMAGVSLFGTEYSSKISDNHHTALYSTATEYKGVATFNCRESNTGVCHYTLYSEACTQADACNEKPMRVFTLKRGESKKVEGISKFHPCVSLDANPLGPDCEGLTP